jgi:hypothetical protein
MKASFVRAGVVVAALVAMWFAAGSAHAQEKYRFRDLVDRYFEEGKGEDIAKTIGYKTSATQVIALRYKVLLYEKQGDQAAERVVDPKTYSFKVGDRIRLAVEPFTESNVYVFHVGPNKTQKFLVPRKGDEPPRLPAKKEMALPARGYFEFIPPSGDEKVLVVASEKPIGDQTLLASVLLKYNDPNAVFSPQEETLRKSLYAAVEANLKSVAEQRNELRDKVVRFRGLGDEKDQKALAGDVEAKKPNAVTMEIPRTDVGTTAVCIIVNRDEAAKSPAGFFVTIPLNWK